MRGELSPDDYHVIAQTIRATLGEAGVTSVLGRSLTWSTAGFNKERRIHISLTSSAGRTQIRAEERVSQLAGVTFGGIVGGGGGGFGATSFGAMMSASHSPSVALLAASAIVASAYAIARTIFSRTVNRRANELEGLVAKLATQITGLVAYQQGPRALR